MISNTGNTGSSVGTNTTPPLECGEVSLEILFDSATTSITLADLEAQLVTQGATTAEGTALAAGAFKIISADVAQKPVNGDVADYISGTTLTSTAADSVITHNGSDRNLDPGGERENYVPAPDFAIAGADGSGVVIDLEFQLLA